MCKQAVNCGVIVLAAGCSTRFGSDKLEACLNGVPMLTYTVHKYAQLGFEIIVVVNQNLSPEVSLSIERLADIVVMRPQSLLAPTPGMGYSLATGIQRADSLGWDAALIGLADMPLIRAETILLLKDGLEHNAAVAFQS